MTGFLDRLRKEPAVIIGILAATTLAVVQSLAGQGVITPDLATTITGFFDNASTELPMDGWGLPVILGLVTRFFVYSPAKTQEIANNSTYLPAGTPVDIGNPPEGPAGG